MKIPDCLTYAKKRKKAEFASYQQLIREGLRKEAEKQWAIYKFWSGKVEGIKDLAEEATYEQTRTTNKSK